jgi:hypothetical protein
VVEVASINDEPGIVARLDGEVAFAIAVHVADGKAHAIHAVRSHEKLAALDIQTPLS